MSQLQAIEHDDLSLLAGGSEANAARRARAKRLLDLVVASALTIAVAPLMLVCIVLIKLADPGPAFYSQWRVGQDGWLFRIYKLRTMYRDAERSTGAVCAASDDDRVIGWCRWMRRSHVDELPQLWNVLRGQMTLVGPRPERPELYQRICRKLPVFEGRLNARPGLTGLAQLTSGYTNDLAGFGQKLESDLRYIHSMSFWGDVKLILQTVPKLWDPKAL